MEYHYILQENSLLPSGVPSVRMSATSVFVCWFVVLYCTLCPSIHTYTYIYNKQWAVFRLVIFARLANAAFLKKCGSFGLERSGVDGFRIISRVVIATRSCGWMGGPRRGGLTPWWGVDGACARGGNAPPALSHRQLRSNRSPVHNSTTSDSRTLCCCCSLVLVVVVVVLHVSWWTFLCETVCFIGTFRLYYACLRGLSSPRRRHRRRHAARDRITAAILPPVEQLPDESYQRLRPIVPESIVCRCDTSLWWTLD